MLSFLLLVYLLVRLSPGIYKHSWQENRCNAYRRGCPVFLPGVTRGHLLYKYIFSCNVLKSTVNDGFFYGKSGNNPCNLK